MKSVIKKQKFVAKSIPLQVGVGGTRIRNLRVSSNGNGYKKNYDLIYRVKLWWVIYIICKTNLKQY